MKHKLNSFYDKLCGYRSHVVPILIGAAAVSLFQVAAHKLEPGWYSWAATVPALLIILVTALARLDDIDVSKTSWHWQVRRIAFVLLGIGCVYGIGSPFTQTPSFPSWMGCMTGWGVALAFLTTPGMPPWWKYITGEKDED